MDLSKKRNSFFDLCKSVAILLVIVTHMNVFSNGLCRKTILYFVINQAVPLFMIVSGFLLSASYCKSVCSGNMPLGRWYARRFLRLCLSVKTFPCCIFSFKEAMGQARTTSAASFRLS